MFWMCCCGVEPPDQIVLMQNYFSQERWPGSLVNLISDVNAPAVGAFDRRFEANQYSLSGVSPDVFYIPHTRTTNSIVFILQGVDVLQGQTVVSATITATATVMSAYSNWRYIGNGQLASDPLTNSAALLGGRLRAALAPNQGKFANYAAFNAATWTTASVTWSEIGSNDFADRPIQPVVTPSLVPIIQEVVDLVSWQRYNSIAIWAELQFPPSVEYDPYPWADLNDLNWTPAAVGDKLTRVSEYLIQIQTNQVTYAITT